MTTTVVNIRHGEQYDVYIGRGSREFRASKWANMFRVGLRYGNTLEQAIALYEQWIVTRPELMAALSELKGKRLGCYCKPMPCHGDVLVRLVEERLWLS